MADLKETLADLLAGTDRGFAKVNDLRVTTWPDGVLNIDRDGDELTPGDVARTREALTELGYLEIEAWMPKVGVSWLSDGIPAGVSFRIRKAS